jgi:hypothetical protein
MAKDISKKALAAKKARRAQKEMLAYMEENNLDPKKDWTGHKKHGKKIQAWIDVINLGNKKARELNEEKAIEKSEKKKNKKPEAHPKKEEVTSTPNAYDYPTVDGKEMTLDQKKKYRQKMRTLLKTMSKEKAEAEGKKYAVELASGSTAVPKEKEKKKEPAKEKKAEKPAKEKKAEKPAKEDKDKKKKKKAKKEED